MKPSKSNRIILLMECQKCLKSKLKTLKYTTQKNKKNTPNKLELKKYCSQCKNRTLYKEVK